MVETQTGTRNRNRDSELSSKQLVAEGLHISRPLVHCQLLIINGCGQDYYINFFISVLNGIVSGVVMETLAYISCNGRHQV